MQDIRLSDRYPLGALLQSPAIPHSLSSSLFNYWQDQIGLNASWEIDFWGRFRRNIESADASLAASVADYDSALVSLTADVTNSYIMIRTLEKRLAIARKNVEVQRGEPEGGTGAPHARQGLTARYSSRQRPC